MMIRWKCLLIVPALLAFGFLPHGASGGTILDLVNDLRPSSSEKTLPIFTDTTFQNGTACVWKYPSKNPTDSKPLPLQPADFIAPTPASPKPTLKQVFFNSPWKITTWVKNRTYPNACSSLQANPAFETAISSRDGAVDLKTRQVGTPDAPIVFSLRQDRFFMSSRSVEFWETIFGAPLFRSSSDHEKVSWPNNFISRSMSAKDESLLWMNQYARLHLVFDAELAGADVNTRAVPLPAGGILPAGAQLEYDPQKHASQFRLALLLQYRMTPDQQKSCKKQKPDPVCAQPEAHGKYVSYMINFYDERFDYFSRWLPYWLHGKKPSRFMYDKGTNTMMYRESLEAFLDGEQRAEWFEKKGVNPYKVAGNRFRIEGDILPLLKAAILQTEGQRMPDRKRKPINALPPRLPGSGTNGLETDAEYLSHFVISSANLGYEISGLSQLGFVIHAFTMTAE